MLSNAHLDSLRLETQLVSKSVMMVRWKTETSADLALRTTARNVLSAMKNILNTASSVLKERTATLTVGN